MSERKWILHTIEAFRLESNWWQCAACLLAAVTLCSCALPEPRQASPVPEVLASERPVSMQLPGSAPRPPLSTPGGAVETIGVSTRERFAQAVYRQAGRRLSLTIPPSENVIPGKSSTRGKGIPGPTGADKASDTSGIESWIDSSGGFASTNFNDNATHNSGFLFIPPDSHAAAGPLHVVGVANTTISFHRKDGTLDFRGSLADFFAPLSPLTFTFDPKVVFDQYNDRWLIVTLEQTDTGAGDPADTSRIFLGVSDDANPNGTWYVAEFNSRLMIGGNWVWADYPGFAVGEEAVYITANMFPFNSGSTGTRLWIVDKGEGSGGLYDGGAAGFSLHDPYAGAGISTTTQPAHMYGAIPGITDTYLLSYSGLTDGTNEYVQVVRVDDPLGTPVFTQSYSSLGNIENTNQALPDSDQLGTATDIEVNDRRALDAVWINDEIWTSFTIRGPAGSPNSGQATAYWVAVDATNPASLAIADQGLIGGEDIAAGTATFFPSVAVNGYGDVALGFSASDNSIYPGAYFTTREAGDAAGTTGASQTVAAGLDYYIRTFGGPRNRWGDYSATVVDPVDGCFWMYNEYAMSRGTTLNGEDGRWATAFLRSCNLTHPCIDSINIPADTWTRFGMPCNVAPDDTVEDVFSALVPGDYGTTWIVFRRNPGPPPAYLALALTDSLVTGEGYWVFTENATVVNLNGTINALEDIDLIGDSMDGVANYIGHNQDASISWADILFVDGGDLLTLDEADTAGMISRQMYKWNGSAYQVFNGLAPQVGSLDSFDGVWVRVFDSGLRLRIPQAAAVSVDGPTSAAENSADAQEPGGFGAPATGPADSFGYRQGYWHVQLTAESGGLSDPGNYFGRMAGSHEGSDINDLVEPAPFGDRYLTILFNNPRLDDVPWGYTSDFRQLRGDPRGKWPFVVRASDDVSQVTLSWQGDAFLFEDAWLADHATGELFKVQSRESYVFDMPGGERHFTFVID